MSNYLARLCAFCAVLVALTGCGQRASDPYAYVFNDRPLDEMSQRVDMFRQLPTRERYVLLTYLSAMELARIKGATAASVEGRSVAQVLPDAATYVAGVEKAVADGAAVQKEIAARVRVQLAGKEIVQALDDGTPVQLLQLTYQVTNTGDAPIAGVRGRAVLTSVSGEQVAAFETVFAEPLDPGHYITANGGGAIRIGEGDHPAARVARQRIEDLRFVFIPSVLVFQDGRRFQVPTL